MAPGPVPAPRTGLGAGGSLHLGLVPHIAWELTNALVAVAALVLGLAVWATTGGAILSKVGAIVLMAGVVTLAWQGAVTPSVMTTVAGSAIVALGGLVEGRPSRRLAALILVCGAGFAAGYWLVGDDLIPLVLLGYAGVGVALARSAGDSRRPIAIGVVATAIAVAVIWVGATVTSPRVLYHGYPLTCDGVSQVACEARVDAVVADVSRVETSPALTYATVDATSAWVCVRWPDAGDPDVLDSLDRSMSSRHTHVAGGGDDEICFSDRGSGPPAQP